MNRSGQLHEKHSALHFKSKEKKIPPHAFVGKKSFPVILHYKNFIVCMLLNTGVILNNFGSAKFSLPKRYAIIADFYELHATYVE